MVRGWLVGWLVGWWFGQLWLVCWLCSFSLVGLCVSFEPFNLFDLFVSRVLHLFCFLAFVLLVFIV